jgi:ABC-type antimicrobial peptide transport system permease subunit
MALGATRADILRLVVRSGLRLILPGAALGLLLAFAVSRALSSLLFAVDPHDPVVFTCATVLLLLVALAAAFLPAASATAVDPAVALRCD